ncbi:MAG: hypothetical protein AAGG48_23390 [Planctomycetota bacterium]
MDEKDLIVGATYYRFGFTDGNVPEVSSYVYEGEVPHHCATDACDETLTAHRFVERDSWMQRRNGGSEHVTSFVIPSLQQVLKSMQTWEEFLDTVELNVIEPRRPPRRCSFCNGGEFDVPNIMLGDGPNHGICTDCCDRASFYFERSAKADDGGSCNFCDDSRSRPIYKQNAGSICRECVDFARKLFYSRNID